MNLSKLLTKSLLVVAGLLAGVNGAWADDTSGKTVSGSTVTETYDFNGWGLANLASKTTATIGKASDVAHHTIGETTSVYVITNPVGKENATLNLYERFAMNNPGTDRTKSQVLFYNSDKNGNRADLGGTAKDGYISILNLPKDATITITVGGTIKFKSTNVKNSSNETVSADDEVTSNETYTVTTAGNVDFYHNTWSGFRKVVISYESAEEVVTQPTLVLTGANGNSRTITVTDGSSSDGTATLTTYYTTNGDTPTSSSTAVEGGKITVSESCTIKAITISSKGGKSSVVELAVEAGTPIVLNNPVFSRTAETKVSITAPQSVLGTPTATIYYRIGDTGEFAKYSEELTVSTANTVYAYATATGYANSETVSKQIAFVNSLPQVSSLSKVNTFTSGGLNTEAGVAGSSITYYPLVIDENQWGNNIYFENSSNWGFRSNNTWYNSSASSTSGFVMFTGLMAGDIVVVKIEEKAVALNNAIYLDKYSFKGHHAYEAVANGNMELRFSRRADKGNNVFTGVDQYPNTTFTLSSGMANRLVFHNAGSGSANDENWKMNIYYGGNKVSEVRADWWDNVAANNENFTNPYVFSADGGITSAVLNWETFLSDAQDAVCDFTISHSGEHLYIIGTMTKGNNVYYVNYSKNNLYNDVSIYLYGNNATLTDISYNPTDVNTKWAAPSGKISTTVTNAGWATLYTPYALDFSGVEGLEAYTAACADNKVTLTKVDDVPANSGVVLKGAANTYSIPVIASSTTDKGELTGSATAATAYNAYDGFNLYMLAKNAQGEAQFTKVTSGSIAAGKAFLKLSNTIESRSLTVGFADEATGISDATRLTDNGEWIKDNVYNLNGQRVNKPKKGLYVVNGKKVIINK